MDVATHPDNFFSLIFFLLSFFQHPRERRKFYFIDPKFFLEGSLYDCFSNFPFQTFVHFQSPHLKCVFALFFVPVLTFASFERNRTKKTRKMDSSKAAFTKMSFRCFRSPICPAHSTVSASSNRRTLIRHRAKKHSSQFAAQKIKKLFAFTILACLQTI